MNGPAHDTGEHQTGKHESGEHDTGECVGSEALLRDGALVRVLTICNRKGLHARASARFVQTVEKFDAEVRVMRCGETVGGTSIMGLMMLAAAPGTKITVEATGREAAEVVEALTALIDSRFGENE